MSDDDLTTAYLLGAEQMRDKLREQADEIEKLNDTRIDYIVKINKLVDERANLKKENELLRKALTAIVNDVGFHNPMRMTTEISDKLLYEAAGVLNDKD